MRVDDDYLPYPDIDDDADEGFGILYPISIFFALGIWLVFQRYHSMRNRAVPFRVRAPEVRCFVNLSYELALTRVNSKSVQNSKH